MNILLTANESAGLNAFRIVNESGHDIIAVATPIENTAIRIMAQKKGIPVIDPIYLKDPLFAEWISKNKVDVLLNVHLLYIIHPCILNEVSFGAFNLHPGPLPKYAGLNAPSWAIHNGETEHGVTLHWLEPGIDTGPIAYKSVIPVHDHDTGLSVSTRSSKDEVELIKRLMEDCKTAPASIPKQPQDMLSRHYYGKNDRPNNGIINWDTPSVEIDRFIRASNYAPFQSPWGVPRTWYKKAEVEVYSIKCTPDKSEEMPGTIGASENGMVTVATADYQVQLTSCSVQGEIISPAAYFVSGEVLS